MTKTQQSRIHMRNQKPVSRPHSFFQPTLTNNPDVTLNQLKRMLASEETKAGMNYPHSATPSSFIQMAIDIEERQ